MENHEGIDSVAMESLNEEGARHAARQPEEGFQGVGGERRRKGEDVIRGLRTEVNVLLDHNDRMSRRITEMEFEVERMIRLDKANQAAIFNLTKACESERRRCAMIARGAEVFASTTGEAKMAIRIFTKIMEA